MSYSILSTDAPPYQSPVLRGSEHLAVLEDVCTLYQRSGYHITSHSADSFVLTRPRSGVNLFVVLVLLAAPPLLLLYVIVARNARDEVVCVRINSRGIVEETGDTLDAVRAARRRSWIVTAVVLAGVFAFISLILAMISYQNADRSFGSTTGGGNLSPSSTDTYSGYDAPPQSSTGKSKRKGKAANADEPYVSPYSAPYEPSDTAVPPVAYPSAVTPVNVPDVDDSYKTVPPGVTKPKPANPETPTLTKTATVRLVNDGDVFFSSRVTGDTVYSKSEVDAPAQLIHRPEPVRTGESVGTSGVVRLEAVCRADGTVTDIRIIKGLPNELTWAAVQAAHGITFTPAIKDGVAVPMLLRITYNFKAN